MINFLSFMFWFFYSVRIVIVALFFSKNPSVGTLFVASISSIIFFVTSIVYIVFAKSHMISIFRANSVKLIAIFVIWSGSSALWSVAKSQFVAFSYWIYMVFFPFFNVVMLAKIGNIKDIVLFSLTGYTCGSILVAFVALFIQGVGDRLGDGFLLHTNSIGHNLGLAALFSIFLATTQIYIGAIKKIFWSIVSIFIFFIFLMTLSKTSIVAFLIACSVMLFMSNISVNNKILMLSIILIVFFALAVRVEQHIDQYLKNDNMETAKSLSGRTILWDNVIDMINEKPIVGHGVMSFRDFFIVPHAHNEFLTLWFSYGLVGVVNVILIYMSYLHLAVRSKNDSIDSREIVFFSISIMIFELARGVTEADPISINFNFGLIMLFCFFLHEYKNNY